MLKCLGLPVRQGPWMGPDYNTVLLAEDSWCSSQVRPTVIHSLLWLVLNTSFRGEAFAQFNADLSCCKVPSSCEPLMPVCSSMKTACDRTFPGRVCQGSQVWQFCVSWSHKQGHGFLWMSQPTHSWSRLSQGESLRSKLSAGDNGFFLLLGPACVCSWKNLIPKSTL